MSLTIEKQDAYAAAFEATKQRSASSPKWLTSSCEKAWNRFVELGFPTTKDEEWRFTNVTPIADGGFTLPDAAVTELDARSITPFLFDDTAAAFLVFVDGRYAPRLSSLAALPKGVTVVPLAGAIETRGELVRHHLGACATYRDDAFTALNTALMTDGAFVHVARSGIVERPIHLLFVSTQRSEGTQSHPRNLVIAEENSQATVVENYVSIGDAAYFTNAVTEIAAGQNSTVHHYLIERESAKAFNISTLTVRQGRSSNFTSHSVLLGGKLVRNNVHPILDGDGCFSLLNGLYVLGDSQHVDNHMLVEHAKPHGDSRQYYKGILGDRSRGVFGGRIVVHKDAQKTDAKQTNTNLLLTDEAHVDTKPQLEIYADDVKCTHGATIGQLDDEAVFYLRARGLTAEAARGLLLRAYVNESLERMAEEPIRAALERAILDRLPQASAWEQM